MGSELRIRRTTRTNGSYGCKSKSQAGRQTRVQIAEEETGIEFSSMRRSRGIALFKLEPMPADMFNAH